MEKNNRVFAERLINARKVQGFSQRQLSERLGNMVTGQAIAKYEKGEMLPAGKVLIALAKELKVSVDYFFRPFSVRHEELNFEFRKKSTLGTKQINAIKATVADRLERYLEIENVLNDDSIFNTNYSDTIVEDTKSVTQIAMRLRNDWNCGLLGIDNAIELVENHGVKVIEIDAPDSFDGNSTLINNIPVIALNKNMQVERKRFSLFHELGHILLCFAKTVTPKEKESLCDYFANEMLIPQEMFVREIGKIRHDISLKELKTIQENYGISAEALMYKAKALEIISSKRYQTFCIKKNKNPQLKQELHRSVFHNDSSLRFVRLVYKALASDFITISKAAELMGLSVNNVRDELNLV